MKTKIFYHFLFSIIVTAIIYSCVSADKTPENVPTYVYGESGKGTEITLQFEKGKEHNHPLFAVWLADADGKYIQTLYVSESVGRGVFKRVNHKTGQWQSGEIQRPATLPYWIHQRNVMNEKGTLMPTPTTPVVDAHTGATPLASFVLKMTTDTILNGKYKLFMELNQSWDWNEYWTNDKFPNDKEYKTSSQPALVYEVDFDTNNKKQTLELNPIGRSHYAGADGNLYTDLNTMTTALKIAKKITVTVK